MLAKLPPQFLEPLDLRHRLAVRALRIRNQGEQRGLERIPLPSGTGGLVDGPGTEDRSAPENHSGTTDRNGGDDRQSGTAPASVDAAPKRSACPK